MTSRTGAVRAAALVLAVALAGCGTPVNPGPTAEARSASPGPSSIATLAPAPVPAPGHELFGFLPYWEMDDAQIVDHVAATPLTTLALFSVTHTSKGAINSKQSGYQRITGDVGRRLIREAHGRGTAVQLVYTSFGATRNDRLFGSRPLQATVIASLVALASDLGLDGIDVDVEGLDPDLVPAYGSFVGDLRAAVVAADAHDTVSVATGAGGLGAAMAVAATGAGADRVFLMGYDYRTGRSQPGATSPLDRSDGEPKSLRWSLDLYATLGVPVERLLLGLPLYGVQWPVAGPVIGAPSTGTGEVWFPRSHVDLLADPAIVPLRDEVEQVEVYMLASDGTVGPRSAAPSASASPALGASPTAGAGAAASSGPTSMTTPGSTTGPTWSAVYVDSPATLAPKLALANERGLAGAGFWAIGYERGLPGYTSLMQQFVAGDALP